MTIAEFNRIIGLVLNAYGADSLIPFVSVVVGGWILLFGYFLTSGTRNVLWSSGSAAARVALVWWWTCASAAVSGGVGWIGFVAWRLSSGLIPLPFAPDEPVGVVFAYGVAVAAMLLAVGGLPLLLVKKPRRAERPAPKPVARPEEPEHQPLYPELSFESYQPRYRAGVLQEAPQTPPAAQRPPAEPAPERDLSADGRRTPAVAAVGAAVAGAVVGVFAIVALSSIGKDGGRFALPGFVNEVAGIFSAGAGDVGDDRDKGFSDLQLDGDIADAADVERWRLLAQQGNPEAQFKLGLILANGNGIARDDIEAYKWFHLAAAQGDTRAAAGRDALAGRMTPAEIGTSEDRAREVASFAAAKRFGDIPSRLMEMSESDLVREAQKLLSARGYQVGTPDGVSGPRTRAAVRDFQRQVGMPETGDATAALVWALENSAQ